MLNSLKRISNIASSEMMSLLFNFIYFFLWNDIASLPLWSVNYPYTKGEISVTQRQGDIRCIPNRNKVHETYFITKCFL